MTHKGTAKIKDLSDKPLYTRFAYAIFCPILCILLAVLVLLLGIAAPFICVFAPHLIKDEDEEEQQNE